MRLGALCMAFLCDPVRAFSCLVDTQFRVEGSGVVKGVRSPKCGVMLGAAGRAMGRRDWKLECALEC